MMQKLIVVIYRLHDHYEDNHHHCTVVVPGWLGWVCVQHVENIDHLDQGAGAL